MQTGQHIFLIGFMGSGKTHWGRLLAQTLELPFLDLDDLISASSGKSIAEIFAEVGESGFRSMEHETLRTLATLPASIIATGGGTPCFFDNMDWMNGHGTTVYLKTAPTLLAERLCTEKGGRPLLSGVNEIDLQRFIEKKVAEREGFYLQARVVLEQGEEEDEGLFWEKLVAAIAIR